MSKDAVHELYERICRGGAKLLTQMKESGDTSESEILDFKRAKTSSPPLTKDDLQNLSKSLSGFSNSSGGVLVWGVECKPDNDGIDRVKELYPISSLNAFKNAIDTNCSQMTSPGLIGVQSESIQEAADTGYVVMYIPKGEGEPVMATASGLSRFYFRSGTSFESMPQWMVADRFGRRPKPKLDLVWRIEHCYPSLHLQASFVFGLKNNGLGLAHFPFVHLSPSFPAQYLGSFNNDSLKPVEHLVGRGPVSGDSFERLSWLGDARHVIHPGITCEFATATIHDIPPLHDHRNFSIAVAYEVACDGYSHADSMVISKQEIYQRLPKREDRDVHIVQPLLDEVEDTHYYGDDFLS